MADQLVFIDESGDLGKKLTRGSSRFFTIALVLFESLEDAQRCQRALNRLHSSLGLPSRHEFKFHDDSHARRLAVLSVVSKQSFHCYTFTLNKTSPKLRTGAFQYSSPSYKWVCKTALQNAGSDLRRANVVIDGSGDRRFRKEMGSYLRAQLVREGQRQIAKVTIGRSHSDTLLQLADYVAGVTNRKHEGKEGSEVYEAYLSSKRRSLRKWP
jgi:hypothetical protein